MTATLKQVQLLLALTRAWPIPIDYEVASTMTSEQISREITVAQKFQNDQVIELNKILKEAI